MTYHVYPEDEKRMHVLKGPKDSAHCECIPKIEVFPNGNVMVVHNAFDGRELVEQGEEILKSFLQ